MKYEVPKLRDVFKARKVISRYLPRTPLIYSKKISEICGFDVYLKLENTLPTRSFKVRGGVYLMDVRKDEAIAKGVITASTGNHAQSIAYASNLIGAEATIVMPHGISDVKVNALKELGAKIVFYGGIYDDACEYAERLAIENDMLYIHGVNEPLLYAGVATMHLENIEDLPDVDVVINPIGGGSGASGAVIVMKMADPRIIVIGVQAEGAKSFYLSWKNKLLTSTGIADTIAEGLATGKAYELPFLILRDRIDDIVLVSDEELKKAIKLLLETEGVVAEPAGAAAMAAACKIRDRLYNKKTVIMVTGGNIDTELLKEVVEMSVWWE